MSSRTPTVPPLLKDGDRMDRREFERRWNAMPDLHRAELIEGVVHIMPSPVSVAGHSREHGRLLMWMGLYVISTPGVDVAPDGSLRLDDDNMPQPDATLYITPESGGRSRWSDSYLAGGPELVAEVSHTSVRHDLDVKMPVYQRCGIQEYIVWRVADREIDWFALRDGEYQPIAPTDDGLIRSGVFPGLWLDRQALIADDRPRITEVSRLGLADPAHAEFVRRLAGATS